ncbi:hypothetical protein [Rhizobium sp. ZW T2_16]|uniref:hypothetical protein n=1 Tax=Rhizobium sp. ZW T2_16 TaxID=3378083 RepID=UPI00385330F7
MSMFAHEARRIREIAAKDTAFQGVSEAELNAAEARLAQAATIDSFRLEAMRTLALGRNGHSRAIANIAVQVAPIRLVWLADGPCLVEGLQAGARLLAVNGISVAEIFARLRPYLAGTDQRARALGRVHAGLAARCSAGNRRSDCSGLQLCDRRRGSG